jgi:hypothetical protein
MPNMKNLNLKLLNLQGYEDIARFSSVIAANTLAVLQV